MALNRKRDPLLEDLIRQAAADVRQVNPHIGAPQQPTPDAERAAIERERQEAERIWDELDRQRGGPLLDEPAARAVDEARGE
ncbi:MAG TPA: hypothetical protein VE338_19850 [Ktedonobacterales bacterium]|jgi:hypothetical protein|nr:hypothetical protein [Ktedonobacterales bacterium]